MKSQWWGGEKIPIPCDVANIVIVCLSWPEDYSPFLLYFSSAGRFSKAPPNSTSFWLGNPSANPQTILETKQASTFRMHFLSSNHYFNSIILCGCNNNNTHKVLAYFSGPGVLFLLSFILSSYTLFYIFITFGYIFLTSASLQFSEPPLVSPWRHPLWKSLLCSV